MQHKLSKYKLIVEQTNVMFEHTTFMSHFFITGCHLMVAALSVSINTRIRLFTVLLYLPDAYLSNPNINYQALETVKLFIYCVIKKIIIALFVAHKYKKMYTHTIIKRYKIFINILIHYSCAVDKSLF